MVVTPQEIKDKLERILPKVQKPGRYTGGEFNQVVKNWGEIESKVALVFPDIYDIGMSNLGLAILYDIINQRTDALAERAYCPWHDMEAEMRQHGVPLYSLETKHALADFDIIGISLPYESLYTNALNVLNLAGIPIYCADREQHHPLIIAGGNATFNPEPMHAFIDAFVIGEGEEVIHEIIDVFRDWKKSEQPRTTMLQNLSQIAGIYVPSLYQVNYHPNGVIRSTEKLFAGASFPIRKRIVAKLPPPPTNFIVPYIETVHNRVPVEIMRGCSRGCRFCHAGWATRPVRERSVDEIITAIDKAVTATGYEEVGLLSLSSSDYTHILELVRAIDCEFGSSHLSVSLPSLRIETFSVEIMEELKVSRRGGFTLAPEAATENMRKIINKPLNNDNFMEMIREIFSRGWPTVKLYFMIGHPSETIEDVEAIVDLCLSTLAAGRKLIGRRAQVNVGVSTFIPKPHTPFQWAVCDTMDQIKQKQAIIKNRLRGDGLKVTWNAAEETMFEAWLSRGDRRLSNVIYRAWQSGAKFDAWSESFRSSIWLDAFESEGLDPEFYTHRVRSAEEIFPWDHISTAVRKKILYKEFTDSNTGEIRPDCSSKCYGCGVLPVYRVERSQNPGKGWKCPEVRQNAAAHPILEN